MKLFSINSINFYLNTHCNTNSYINFIVLIYKTHAMIVIAISFHILLSKLILQNPHIARHASCFLVLNLIFMLGIALKIWAQHLALVSSFPVLSLRWFFRVNLCSTWSIHLLRQGTLKFPLEPTCMLNSFWYHIKFY